MLGQHAMVFQAESAATCWLSTGLIMFDASCRACFFWLGSPANWKTVLLLCLVGHNDCKKDCRMCRRTTTDLAAER